MDKTCRNCNRTGHTLRYCVKADPDGRIGGCPRCNTLSHDYDECWSRNKKTNDDWHYLIQCRPGRPLFRTALDITSITGSLSDGRAVSKRHGTVLNVARKPWSEDFTKQMMRENPNYWCDHRYEYWVEDEQQLDDPYWNTLQVASGLPSRAFPGGYNARLPLVPPLLPPLPLLVPLLPPLPMLLPQHRNIANSIANQSAKYAADHAPQALSHGQSRGESQAPRPQEKHIKEPNRQSRQVDADDYDWDIIATKLLIDKDKHWPVLDIEGNILYSALLDPRLFKPFIQDSEGRNELTEMATRFNCKIEGFLLPSGYHLLMWAQPFARLTLVSDEQNRGLEMCGTFLALYAEAYKSAKYEGRKEPSIRDFVTGMIVEGVRLERFKYHAKFAASQIALRDSQSSE